ncbi:glycosyltransferase [Lonepinella sp. BR2357]|uniref:glycosyltransferase n=1 Tax=Lonepinella sp. BR2357 TaxID=3434549 RepID=UPI003F6DCFFB
MLQPEYYFNSGVLFFDSNLWHLDERTLIETTKQLSVSKFPDQDVLNHLIQEHYYPLPKQYNYQIMYLYQDMSNFIQEKNDKFIFPCILHFAFEHKPWHQLDNPLLHIAIGDLGINLKTHLLFGNNLFDFYKSLNWEMIVNLPPDYFQPLAKQIYKQNFDYVVKGIAEIELTH